MGLILATNFDPLPAATVSIAATGTSARVEVRASSQPELQGKWYLVQNFDAANVVFIEVGGAAVDAVVAGSMPLGPEQSIIINGSHGRYVAAICGVGLTAAVYITPGHI